MELENQKTVKNFAMRLIIGCHQIYSEDNLSNDLNDNSKNHFCSSTKSCLRNDGIVCSWKEMYSEDYLYDDLNNSKKLIRINPAFEINSSGRVCSLKENN